jgi:hypothetical protein
MVGELPDWKIFVYCGYKMMIVGLLLTTTATTTGLQVVGTLQSSSLATMMKTAAQLLQLSLKLSTSYLVKLCRPLFELLIDWLLSLLLFVVVVVVVAVCRCCRTSGVDRPVVFVSSKIFGKGNNLMSYRGSSCKLQRCVGFHVHTPRTLTTTNAVDYRIE